MLLLLVMSKSRLFIAQFVFSPVCLSIRECAQNLGKIFRLANLDRMIDDMHQGTTVILFCGILNQKFG